MRPSKLGMTYTARPSRPVRVTPLSSVCESVSEKSAMPTIITSSPGMTSLAKRSTPFSTPPKTTSAVTHRNSSVNTMGETGEVMKAVK